MAAIAVATSANAQDTAFAGCIELNDCSLTEATVTVSAQQANFDLVGYTLIANYGSVDVQPMVDDLPEIGGAENGHGAVYVSSTKPEFLSYSGAAEFYVNGINLSEVVEGRTLSAYGPWGTPKYVDAFSYSFNDRWRFKANPMDDGGPALQAIAAGAESNPEDLLWHLSDPDFSVNLGLVRKF
jgi:hypothetical protein